MLSCLGSRATLTWVSAHADKGKGLHKLPEGT